MELLLRPWKMYADSTGRARRSEYWLFFGVKYGVLVLGLTMFALMSDGPGARAGGIGTVWVLLLVVFLLGSLVPSVTLLARRAHDFDASGKWSLATFIQYIGFIAVIVIGLIPPTRGENERGYDPREQNMGHLDAVFD